ncbi:hypothetical protein ABT264_35160 [Streptomyces virginiae]|uniref:hypothetical protein n=1 Tax=Streptomyces virginiae TaxID=1961 RepID=UPI003331A542
MTEQPTPWCCRGWAQGCPLCPDYGTRKTEPCPGHDETPDNQQTIATSALHARQAHPGWEYATTEGPRKQWDYSDEPPSDDNGVPDPTWQRNIDAGYPGEGWERFDYTEESYWRRPLAEAAEPVVDEEPAAGYCPHCGSGDAGPTPEAYETARQRAVLLQTRIDNARDWARRNLTDQQHAGLLGVLRGDEPHACRPGAGYYWCPTAGEVESDCHGGHDTCCDQPERHEPLVMCGAKEGCGHPADSHSVYGCEDHCACEWMPGTRPVPEQHPALALILADANHHELCAIESKTPEGGISHSSIAAGLRIAARHLLAAQKEPRP